MKHLIRTWIPYWAWEEVKYNMWGEVSNEQKYANMSLKIMKNTDKWGKLMMKVVKDWNNSCLHNLTNTSQNRIAWLGQAAIAYGIKCPEYIVRNNWSLLSEKQQKDANKKAEIAIRYWIKKHDKNTT